MVRTQKYLHEAPFGLMVYKIEYLFIDSQTSLVAKKRGIEHKNGMLNLEEREGLD
jgi:hypothetical protein